MPIRATKDLRSPAHQALITVLVACRNEARLTQRDLAAVLGKPYSWVNKIELGERGVSVLEFCHWAEACGLDPEVMFARFRAWLKGASRPVG